MPARTLWALFVALVAACASEVVRTPVEVSAGPLPKRFMTLESVHIRLDSGYDRTIAKGTQFVELGTISQGRILKPTTTTFTIEGAHAHEAYPVLHGERIVGFYLPVERAFSPLSQSANLLLQEREASK